MKRVRIGIGLAAALLTACSGGGGMGSSLPRDTGPAFSSAPRATVTFTLVLPARGPAATAERAPRYVSRSTVSAVVTLTAFNGTDVPSPQPYAVTIDYASGCTTLPQSVGRSVQTRRIPLSLPPPKMCTISIPAPVGMDTFAIGTYDAAQSSPTPASLTGNLLSTGVASTTVLANSANSVTVALDGVIASLSLSLNSRFDFSSTGQRLFVTARDADGNTIVGPGNYTTPITLAYTVRYQGASIGFSTTTVTSPSTVVAISYSQNTCNSANFTASAPNVPTFSTSSLAGGGYYFFWGSFC